MVNLIIRGIITHKPFIEVFHEKYNEGGKCSEILNLMNFSAGSCSNATKVHNCAANKKFKLHYNLFDQCKNWGDKRLKTLTKCFEKLLTLILKREIKWKYCAKYFVLESKGSFEVRDNEGFSCSTSETRALTQLDQSKVVSRALG